MSGPILIFDSGVGGLSVVKALREQMPEDHYHIERDDGEDVLIKRRRGTASHL